MNDPVLGGTAVHATHPRPHRLLALLLAAVLAVALAACGGTDDGAGGDDASADDEGSDEASEVEVLPGLEVCESVAEVTTEALGLSVTATTGYVEAVGDPVVQDRGFACSLDAVDGSARVTAGAVHWSDEAAYEEAAGAPDEGAEAFEPDGGGDGAWTLVEDAGSGSARLFRDGWSWAVTLEVWDPAEGAAAPDPADLQAAVEAVALEVDADGLDLAEAEARPGDGEADEPDADQPDADEGEAPEDEGTDAGGSEGDGASTTTEADDTTT